MQPENGTPSKVTTRDHPPAITATARFGSTSATICSRSGATLIAAPAWLDAGERVALTCFERAPGDCHRHCVGEALQRTHSSALVATDL